LKTSTPRSSIKTAALPSSKIKTSSPRFMSPTVASSRNKATTHTAGNSRKQVASPNMKVGKAGTWMASAAKRVGIGRTASAVDASKRGEKAIKPKDPVRVVNLPDKVDTESVTRSNV
jgi:hypothetical protein